MKSSTLTIRNLTPTAIELKRVGRSDRANQSYFSKFCCLFFTKREVSKGQLACKSGSFSKRREESPINIGPFKSKTTQVQITSNELIHFAFEAYGQQYEVDIVPGQLPHSAALACRSSTSHFKITAIFHPKLAHMALFSSSNCKKWMSELDNDIPLSALSIPGTHNSPTYYKALPSVRCQAVDVMTQLQNGIRFLDIRVQPENPKDLTKDQLILVHSTFPISLTGKKYLRDVINVVDAFLLTNPSETVIISLKREGMGKSTDEQLCKILHDNYAGDKNHWFTDDRIPTLGEVRKKIVLLRRFCLDESLKRENGNAGWGLDAERWPDNCAEGSCAGDNIRIQDFYDVSTASSIEKKIAYSVDQLKRSAQSNFDLNSVANEIPKNPFFVNFLSASSFWSTSCWPDKVAAKVNPQILEYLCLNHHNTENSSTSAFEEAKKNYMGNGSTGIVVCDWAGKDGNWDLVNCIIGMNARLHMI